MPLRRAGKKNARSSFRLGEIYLFILQIRVILARRDKIVGHSKNSHFSNNLDFYVDIFKLHVTVYFFMFMRRGMNFTFWQYLDYVTCTLSVINFVGFCLFSLYPQDFFVVKQHRNCMYDLTLQISKCLLLKLITNAIATKNQLRGKTKLARRQPRKNRFHFLQH